MLHWRENANRLYMVLMLVEPVQLAKEMTVVQPHLETVELVEEELLK